MTGTELTHVPYRGGAPAMNDLIGGQVDLFFEAVANVVPHVEGGRAAALMSTGPTRSHLLPSVPTAGELGYRDLTLTSWTGFAVPASTPASVIETLNLRINEALRTPEVIALTERIGISGIGGSPADMAERIAGSQPSTAASSATPRSRRNDGHLGQDMTLVGGRQRCAHTGHVASLPSFPRADLAPSCCPSSQDRRQGTERISRSGPMPDHAMMRSNCEGHTRIERGLAGSPPDGLFLSGQPRQDIPIEVAEEWVVHSVG